MPGTLHPALPDPAPFSWANPYPSVRTPVFARNVVSTSQPVAAAAGLRILDRGGNAVDAAVAAAACIAITEPCSNGLGSDAFALVWHEGRLHGLNASGTAPAAWSVEHFRSRHASGSRPERGWDTITVPGAVAGWAALHGRFGRLPFEEVLGPAIDVAARGFAVGPFVQERWRQAAPLLAGQPGFSEHFLPGGRVPGIGENFVLAGAQRALRSIATTRGESYYRGEIAAAISRHARDCGGAMTETDLAAYRPIWVDPIHASFAGHELHQIPPNGQGIAALLCLGILRHADISRFPVDGADWMHAAIEAMKLAFADVHAHVAEPGSMRLSTQELLDEGYLQERARRIDMGRAQAFASGRPRDGGTIYLAAADERGTMVSFIQSNYMGFGSGVVVPGWGISLHNRGLGFSLDPAHPNCVAPGKRPFHTIIPGFLTQGGAPRMAFGVMGAIMQPQGQVQTLLRMLLAGQQPQAACDAPRWKWLQGLDIELEDAVAPAVCEELARRGHRIVRGEGAGREFGAGQFLWRLGGQPDPQEGGASPAEPARYVAASDSRRDGQACGY
jgi:gamma-glutamyltranspeptidase/glutathione hydrolase